MRAVALMVAVPMAGVRAEVGLSVGTRLPGMYNEGSTPLVHQRAAGHRHNGIRALIRTTGGLPHTSRLARARAACVGELGGELSAWLWRFCHHCTWRHHA